MLASAIKEMIVQNETLTEAPKGCDESSTTIWESGIEYSQTAFYEPLSFLYRLHAVCIYDVTNDALCIDAARTLCACIVLGRIFFVSSAKMPNAGTHMR